MNRFLYFLIIVLAFVILVWIGLDARADVRRSDLCGANGITSKYDDYFQKAVRRYWSQEYNRHWCLMKAQCYVESNLDPDAESHAGALGLCQIVSGTWSDISKRIDLRSTGRRNPLANITAGVYYMGEMIRVWMAPRSTECRIELAWASYNAGAGNIIAAQRDSGGRRCWVHISPYLPGITGLQNSAETQGYVARIWSVFRRLKGVSL